MRPGLVPLTFSEEDRDFCAALSGVSIDVEVQLRPHFVPGERAVHTPGPQRPGDPAGVQLLA